MKLHIHKSLLAASLTAAFLVLLPASSQGQARKISDPFNWLDRYDSTQMTILTGVIREVDWTNPHIYISLDVKDASGKVTPWQVEGYPPNALKRSGFLREDLKDGDTVTITAFRAKDGSNSGAGSDVTFPDGSKKFAGPKSATFGISPFNGTSPLQGR